MRGVAQELSECSSPFLFLSPVCPASQLARAGRLSKRSRNAFVDEVVTGGAERAPKRAQRIFFSIPFSVAGV
jgi:hypothetical protein